MNQQSLLENNKGILNEQQKDAVVHFYVTGGKSVTQTWIANHFRVSRRTIYNVLKERGALLDKNDTKRLLSLANVMQEYDLNAAKLRERLETPDMTANNIVQQLVGMEGNELFNLMYEIMGMKYMKQVVQQNEAQHAA